MHDQDGTVLGQGVIRGVPLEARFISQRQQSKRAARFGGLDRA